MIDLLKQFEETPEAYPTVPGGLSDGAAALDGNMIWQRIEAYVAHRWTPREVVWTLQGNGGDDFVPKLTPMTSYSARFWGDQWKGLTLENGPLGVILPVCGIYQIIAQVGDGDVPAAVSEAFRRLAEYSAEIGVDSLIAGHPSHTSHDVSIDGALSESFKRSVTWTARSMQLSGAADLLRPYRRA